MRVQLKLRVTAGSFIRPAGVLDRTGRRGRVCQYSQADQHRPVPLFHHWTNTKGACRQELSGLSQVRERNYNLQLYFDPSINISKVVLTVELNQQSSQTDIILSYVVTV